MGIRELLARIGKLGADGQSVVAGTYAWASTVAPVAWSRGASGLSKSAAVLALVVLAAGWPAWKRWGERARIAALWGFVLACALAWAAAPEALNAARIDAITGLTGSLAWGLFALASATPPLELAAGESDDDPLAPRRRLAGRQGRVVLAGAVLAAAAQAFGWGLAGPEKSLFVRLALIAVGLAVIDLSVSFAPRWPRRAAGVMRLDRWYRRKG